jgi:hypothetical protein
MKRTPNKTVLCIWVCTINWKHNKKRCISYTFILVLYYYTNYTHRLYYEIYISPWIFYCEFNEKKIRVLNFEWVSYTSMLIIEYILLLCIWIVCIRWGNIMLNNLYNIFRRKREIFFYITKCIIMFFTRVYLL